MDNLDVEEPDPSDPFWDDEDAVLEVYGKTCGRCGKNKLHWEDYNSFFGIDDRPKWRLFEQDNSLHVCGSTKPIKKDNLYSAWRVYNSNSPSLLIEGSGPPQIYYDGEYIGEDMYVHYCDLFCNSFDEARRKLSELVNG